MTMEGKKSKYDKADSFRFEPGAIVGTEPMRDREMIIARTFGVLFIALLLSPSTSHTSSLSAIAENPLPSLSVHILRATIVTIGAVLGMWILLLFRCPKSIFDLWRRRIVTTILSL